MFFVKCKAHIPRIIQSSFLKISGGRDVSDINQYDISEFDAVHNLALMKALGKMSGLIVTLKVWG